jgi:ATP-dependent RNA/DNA helicase IGHMBP2
VLAAAFSNVATDNLLQGCLEQGLKCVRIGHPATVRPELRGSTLEAQIVEHPLVKQQSSKVR